ncbi:hypothetical protein BDM02DRAFT_3144796 [Thelephora ganbajun]|uniref:Uncharacterized protein n=1 Tax=Thelephora ganbajun TaxID=370292 RepID=A0ACB6ZEZ7_THEGA|nr:hypothetical protein BDM02DRAFT_3144796 [Thelephora ganbajun]
MSTSDPPNYPDDRPVFPQELFDKLIDLVEVDSLRHPALLNFSLVSKAWACHSRKRVFSQVSFTSRADFELWCKNTAPGPYGPSSLVQVLVFSQLREDVWIHPSILLEGEQHLMSFTNLKGWVAFDLRTPCFKDRALLSQCFRVIGKDLRFVRLHRVKGTPQTLALFIQQFPTIQTLSIEYYTEIGDMSPEDPVSETSGQFQGTLRLLSIEFNGLAAIDSIARLPLKYEEVTLISSLHFVGPYNRLFMACAPTLERLRIIDTRKPRSHWSNPIDSSGLTAVGCTELQMVRLGTCRKPGPMLETFIQSINPSKILELVFELIWNKYTDDDIASVVNIPAWEPIDDALCTLARRIREEHSGRRLSVVLSVVAPKSTNLGRVKLGTLFSKFRGEGSIALQYFLDYLPPGVYSPDMPLLAVGG